MVRMRITQHRVATSAFAALGALAACQKAPPADTPAPPTAAPTTTAPTAPPSLAASGLGAALFYAQQQTIEPPPELVDLVPPGLGAKVIERQRGRGMVRMRLAPTERHASLVLLTLAPEDTLRRALVAHFTGRGFTPAPGAPDTFVHPNGDRLSVALTFDPMSPTRVELTLDGAEAPAIPAAPSLAPEIAPDASKLRVVGFEEGLLHAVVAGGRDTDAGRTAYILRAKTAEDRARALAAWTVAIEKAGFRVRPGRPELWERPETRELLVIRPTDAPSGDVLVSHQRRWRR